MLKKLILLTILTFSSFLYSAEFKKEKLQILANDLNSKENIIVAKGDVVIFSPTYYILAQKVIYNKEDGLLELFDDVLILKNNTIQTQSDYAFLDLKNELITQNPVFILDKKSKVWIVSKNVDKKEDDFNLKNPILSSCNCIDPLWSMKSSSAKYNQSDKWLDTYNTRLYIKGIPVLYTPYLGFSTDTKRRTGLLTPTIGYSGTEGFLYSQSYYIAPKDNYDIELTPQYRSNRGLGMYAYYRYIDSKYSKLDIKTGYFKENNSYYDENDLKNSSHYGANINYTRSELFSNENQRDELYASINWLNDIEYSNLEIDGNEISSEKKVESKVNYYLDDNSYYYGAYFRYYLDMSLDSNDTTLQQLPQLQFHKYNDSLFMEKLLYSMDMKYTDYSRKSGINASKTDLLVPLSYSFSFFDDYVNFKLQNEFSFSKIDYTNTNSNFKNASFLENRYSFILDSDLIKTYENWIHTLKLSSDFVIPNVLSSSGDIYNINSTNSELEPFPLEETTKILSFSLAQSWNDKESLKEIIRHKIKQSIIYDDLDNSSLSDLENELIYNYILGSISNRFKYSNLDDRLIEVSSSFTLNYLDYFFRLNHYVSKDTPNSNKENTESYTLSAGYNINKVYSLAYSENYDLENSVRNRQSVSFNINEQCWSLNLNYSKNLLPTSSTTSNNSTQDIIYLQFVLKPIGGINQEYNIGGE